MVGAPPLWDRRRGGGGGDSGGIGRSPRAKEGRETHLKGKREDWDPPSLFLNIWLK